MDIESDIIKWGETYDIEVQAQDLLGEPVENTEGWSAAARITKSAIAGDTVHDVVEMTYSDGFFRCSIDTRNAKWSPGIYFYDVRLTDADGIDYWSTIVRLVLQQRNTPSSV